MLTFSLPICSPVLPTSRPSRSTFGSQPQGIPEISQSRKPHQTLPLVFLEGSGETRNPSTPSTSKWSSPVVKSILEIVRYVINFMRRCLQTQLRNYLITSKVDFSFLRLFFLSHRDPGVGDDNISTRHCHLRITGEH